MLFIMFQVHYFALNDIQARGYLRQYCICYITNSQSKLLNNFEELKSVFSEVRMLYNYIVTICLITGCLGDEIV